MTAAGALLKSVSNAVDPHAGQGIRSSDFSVTDAFWLNVWLQDVQRRS